MSYIYFIILKKIKTDVSAMRKKRYTTLKPSDYVEIFSMVGLEFLQVSRALIDESVPKDNHVAKRVEAVIPYYEKLIATYARLKDIPERTDQQNPKVFSIHDISTESSGFENRLLKKVQDLRQDAEKYGIENVSLKGENLDLRERLSNLSSRRTTSTGSDSGSDSDSGQNIVSKLTAKKVRSTQSELQSSSTESESDDDGSKTPTELVESHESLRAKVWRRYVNGKSLKAKNRKIKRYIRSQEKQNLAGAAVSDLVRELSESELSESDPDISSGEER